MTLQTFVLSGKIVVMIQSIPNAGSYGPVDKHLKTGPLMEQPLASQIASGYIVKETRNMTKIMLSTSSIMAMVSNG